MRAVFALVLTVVLGLARMVQAQEDVVWVQVEAQPSLTAAQERARSYASALPDVNGFALGAGWYGIALGPYLRSDAEQVLRVYRAEGRIPRDSYIAFSSTYREQFYPVGANVLNRGVIEPPVLPQSDAPQTAAASQPEPEPQPQAEPQPEPDETPAEARRSEARLTGQERRDLQVALQWAGYYNAAIDGAFGRGTRASMSEWQIGNGYEPTGVLTTRQRQVLLDQYNAPLTSVGMTLQRDDRAGIEIALPMAEVGFDRYDPPFAHYDSTADLGVRVLLISQRGDRATLFGLYDIMQTLEIVPLDGPRSRESDGFSLTGRNGRIVSHTEATLSGGEIKGFTLIWPAGDEARRTRVLDAMRSTFRALPGALDAAAGAGTVQNIDLVAGLQVRRPRLSRSGFYVDRSGAVVTTAEAVAGCTRITLDADHDARVVATDMTSGIAVLRPAQALAPPAVARLAQTPPPLASDVAVAGYPFEGTLTAPTLTYGTLADVKGLQGEPGLRRLALSALPGDAGGPVLDASGSVMGMLLPKSGSTRQLPADVSFAAGTDSVLAALRQAGLTGIGAGAPGPDATPQELTREGTGMTVLVSCWD
ncbi:MAG: trypsin-like peptidase domain-containing protein [Rhodobacteraceae bacterium]|nr:trypsin-like peptidase domain-containing protein [Paracoccaceae bacterium]